MVGDLQKELEIWLRPLVYEEERSSLDGRLRQIAEAELQIEQGGFKDVFSFYLGFAKDEACFLPAARCALLGAIENGAPQMFAQVWKDLQGYPTWCKRPQAACGANLLKMWMYQVLHVQLGKDERVDLSEVSAFPREWRSLALYIEMLSCRNRGDFQTGYLMTKTLLVLEWDCFEGGLLNLYLKRTYAQFCQELCKAGESERWFREMAEESCGRGWLRPFLGLSLGSRSSAMQVLTERSRLLQNKVRKANKRYLHSLIRFHNQTAKGHLTESLTPREFYVAVALKRGCSYKEIACNMGVSIGRVNILVRSVYVSLDIHSRAELESLVW